MRWRSIPVPDDPLALERSQEPRSLVIPPEAVGQAQNIGVAITGLPSRLIGGDGIAVRATGFDWSISLDIAELEIASEGSTNQWYVPIWYENAGEDNIRRVAVNVIPVDAPADGRYYGRLNRSWQPLDTLPVSWDSITGKPASYPPALHQHAIADVNNLQTELDARVTDAELANEAAERTDADTGLQTGLSNEMAARTNADANLQTQVNGKEPAIASGDPSYFWAGDKLWKPVPAAGIAEAPLDGRQYARQSAAWSVVASGAPGGATISDTPPSSPVTGQFWFEGDSGNLFVRYADPVGGESWWVQVNVAPAPTYDLSFSWENLTPNAETMARFVTPRAFTVPTNASGSFAKAAVAATASTTYTLKKNGTSIGTIVFAAAGTNGTFTVTQTAFAAGDVLTLDGPATADTTLADVAITLVTT
jgi:hypothetical protein